MKEISLRGTLALLLFLACLSQLIFTADSIRGAKEKRRRQESRGDGNIAVFKGKFTTKDKTRCSWLARGEHSYTMAVTCKPGNGDGFTCKYTAKPATCTKYGSNPEGYWKQIARSLKKQKKLCADFRALIRAGMCKRAPLDAHFKLIETSQAKTPKTEKTPITTNTTLPDNKRQCKERIEHSEIAKEKCGDSWGSLCEFLFTMIQSGDCWERALLLTLYVHTFVGTYVIGYYWYSIFFLRCKTFRFYSKQMHYTVSMTETLGHVGQDAPWFKTVPPLSVFALTI